MLNKQSSTSDASDAAAGELTDASIIDKIGEIARKHDVMINITVSPFSPQDEDSVTERDPNDPA